MADTRDAIVIGAGLNGLATAAYLAKAGKRVLVLERRDVIGGSAVTEEIHPGFRVDVCAHDAGWLPPIVAQELSLASHGLTMLQPEATVFAPACDGPPLTLWRDASRTADALRSRFSSDAQRFGAFCDQMGRLAGFLGSVYESPAPRLTSTKPAELFSLALLGRKLRALGKRDMIEFLRVLPMSAAELLDDWFESDTLKGALGGAAIAGVCHGPRSAGTAFVLLHGLVGNAERAIRARSQPRGGIGALPAALALAARQYGAEIRMGADVDRVLVNRGRAKGVVLRGGEEIAANVVASSADPRQTFLRLTGAPHLEPEFVRAVQQIRYRGVAAKVNLALGELPRFAGVTDTAALRGVISVSPSLDYLEKAYDDAKHGGVSRNPYLEVTIPSLTDEALAPAGRHVMSIRMQYAPYALRAGAWTDDRRAALGELVIDTLAEYAPNLPSAILHQQVLTPTDMERVYGAPEGNLDHGEMALDQILFMRPVAGWARHATPIKGLYLCGSGTHPGGRIVGGAGRLAAREILRAASRERISA